MSAPTSDAGPTASRRGRGSAPAPPAAPRLPQPQRQRRLGLAALAVVLVVGFGALAGALVLRSGDRVSVVSVVRPVAGGVQIQRADLGVVDVAVEGIPTVPAAQLPSLVGRYAVVPLISGTILSPVATTDQARPGPGQAVVGLQLAPGRLPADGVRSGDVLRLVRIAGDAQALEAGADPVVVPRATVIVADADGVSGATAVTVLVDEAQATALTVASARGEVAAARVEKAAG